MLLVTKQKKKSGYEYVTPQIYDTTRCNLVTAAIREGVSISVLGIIVEMLCLNYLRVQRKPHFSDEIGPPGTALVRGPVEACGFDFLFFDDGELFCR